MIYIIAVLLSLGSAVYSPFSKAQTTLTNVTNNVAPQNNHWGSKIQPPFESNIYFQNMVVGDGTHPVNFYPYILSVEELAGLGICAPTSLATSTQYVKTPFMKNLTLTAAEGRFSHHSIPYFDQLSLTLKFTHQLGNLTFPIVRGSAMVTAQFFNLTPKLYIGANLQTISLPIGTHHSSQEKVTTNRFILNMETGVHWILYTSKPVTISFTGEVLSFEKPFNGTLRLGFLGYNVTNALIFDKYRDAIPYKASVDYSIVGDQATLTYSFESRSLSGHNECSSQPKDPLIFALPHHFDSLQSPNYESDLSFRTIRGNAVAVVGKVWTLKQSLPDTLWEVPRDYSKNEWKEQVRSALANDKQFSTARVDATDFGQDINKLGRLTLIADSLEQTTTATEIRNKIKSSLQPWLNGTYLAYDTTWGGIVTIKSLNEASEIISNAHYFNHLEDFGNIIYGIAVVAQKEISFYNQYKPVILALVRDLANPSSQDPFFPTTREKDWYLGVSWSTGLDQFEDNRAVESSSASIHGYYAIALLGKAINYSSMNDFARLLMATEIRSSKKYFQIRDNSIYPQEFAKHGMVGVFWDTKVDFSTYDGKGLGFTQANQMRPFSPISEVLLDYTFTLTDYKIYETVQTTEEWLSYQIMDEAIIDPEKAWDKISSSNITDYGANSLTNALWWIATRPLPAAAV